MRGHHLTADLRGCAATLPVMIDPQSLRAVCMACVQAVGLTPVGALFHPFPLPGGVTGMVLLAESHLAVHTWPERGAVTLDVYVCNFSRDHSEAAGRLMASLIEAFAPQHAQRQWWLRGDAQA